jgi:predicted anti-sigma-YlaC factor YlaD
VTRELDCERARTILSALADDEATSEEADLADHHLGVCAACGRYADAIARLDRAVRIRPAEPVPNVVGAVTSRARPARLGRGGWIRPALAWVAVVVFAESVPALVLGHATGADVHMSRHLGAFGVALAIGFAYAAWKPHRAFGLLPFTAALVATMLAGAAFDLLDGGRSALAESVHLAELVGLVLLWVLSGAPGWRRSLRRRREVTGAGTA